MSSNLIRRVLTSSIGCALLFALYLFLAPARAEAAESGALSEQPVASETYVTTAYFLNVRAESNAHSKIIDVVKMGTRLSVIEALKNGWLRLENGGFVHGGYAEPLDEPGRKEEDPPYEKKPVAAKPPTAAAPPAAAKPAAAEKPPATPKSAPNPAAEAAKPDDKPQKPFTKVKSASGLTEEDIRAIFKGTGLANQGLEQAVLEIEQEYGINSFFTIAVMKLESGNGKSKVARTRNNLFGLNSNNGTGYLRFSSKGASVERFGKLISDYYIGKGYTTIEKIGRKYCPANSKWPALVKGVVNGDYKRVLNARA